MADLSAPPETAELVNAQTFGEAFRRRASMHPDRIAVRTVDDEVSLTWRRLHERADALAGGLAKLGLQRGDCLALMLNNRPEFQIADLAAVMLGAVPFSIYQTMAPEQIAFVVADARARFAIIETAFLDRFMEAKANLPDIEHVIVVDGGGGTLRLDEVEGSSPGFDAAAPCRVATADDLLTLIYTSGTTGPPKGVQLSHRNLFCVARGLSETFGFPEKSRVISWLPTAHIAERVVSYYVPVLLGATITCCPDPREIIEYLPRVRPNIFFAVPRIWEKVKAGLETRFASAPEEQRTMVEQALQASIQRVRLEQAGDPVPPELAETVARADTELFSVLRAMLGLDQLAVVNVGAAPTPLDVLEFFHALGIKLAEGWGMSETTAVGTVNPPGRIRLGTVGPPMPGMEIKLAEDGEILVRGENVMIGYRNQPEKTAEAIDSDGWLASGDVGELDAAGYLKIVDRKKELIINAAGKNMSPANIEGTLKASSLLVGLVCVIGDRRPYNTALILLDADYAPTWAAQNGLAGASLDELATKAPAVAAVQAGVDAANTKLSRVEQVKKFTIIPGDWPPGGDELTPTMKLKRKAIGEKYAAAIEAMYQP